MLDFASSYEPEIGVAEILALDADTYMRTIMGRSLQLYSTLSKGVHWEFFTSTLVFDETTVKSAMRDTCLLVSQLGLASHFIPTAYVSLPPPAAFDTYLSFRRGIP